jgi:hypothetical protein
MSSKTRPTLLLLVGLLAFGTVGSGIASAAEAPFWKIGGERLQAGHSEEGFLELKSSKFGLLTKIDGKTVEERCTAAVSHEMTWIGSESEHDGKVALVIKFEKCVLFDEVKEKFVEQPQCEDLPMTWAVKGNLWYGGTKAAGEETIVALLEPTAGTILGTQEITGEECPYAGKYRIEGSVAVLVKPDNGELKTGEIVFSKTPISQVWQPQEEGKEENAELRFGKAKATVEGEFATTLSSGKDFGAFTSNEP